MSAMSDQELAAKMKTLQTSTKEDQAISDLYALKHSGGGAEYATDTSADELVKKAEKKLAAFFTGSGTKNKYEIACDLYEQAAEKYRLHRNYQEAGDAYTKAAELHERQKRPVQAASCYADAGRCYKRLSLEDAMTSFNTAINIHKENGNTQSMGRLYQEVAELQMSEQNEEEALEAFEKACNCYEADDQPASTVAMKNKMAELRFKTRNYEQCAVIYEQVIDIVLQKGLSKGAEKDYFYRAALCRFVLAAKKNNMSLFYDKVREYLGKHRQFDGTYELKLLQGCAKAFENDDIKQFTKMVFDFNKVKELDDFSAKLLLEVKQYMKSKEILGVADEDDDDEDGGGGHDFT